MQHNQCLVNKFVVFFRRAAKLSPSVLLIILRRKILTYFCALWLPQIVKHTTPKTISGWLGFSNPSLLFTAAAQCPPFPIFNGKKTKATYELPNIVRERIFLRAEKAIKREVDFLGSGPTKLKSPIDWAVDFKSGFAWPMKSSPMLDILDFDRGSDIKIPWELSRLQWLLPLGQAYFLQQNEVYAVNARAIIEEWIDENHVCKGPNWVCAMDVALRAISMSWLTFAFKGSKSWEETGFRERLLLQLYIHAKFIKNNLEWSDVTSNHVVANLTGIIIISLSLGYKGEAAIWGEEAWQMLLKEFPLQVPRDGVSREGSVSYHRLVTELFLLPAIARKSAGLPIEDWYWEKLQKMATFVQTYTMPNGSVPLWGDADDGRVLPLGTQPLDDHRYLAEILSYLDQSPTAPSYDETFWWLGIGGKKKDIYGRSVSSVFSDAGIFVFRNDVDFLFVDAGPVGMAGRGGHGHNDCLSFEVVLNGTGIITDSGCYIYTPSASDRNYFRSTGAHNTPKIDGEEINRISNPKWLWYLENDAHPEVKHYSLSSKRDLLIAAHSGYQRLPSPVTPVRSFLLEKETHSVLISDTFEGTSKHLIQIPFHLAIGASILQIREGLWELKDDKGETFIFACHDSQKWMTKIKSCWVSRTYGVREKTNVLLFERNGSLESLTIAIFPKALSQNSTEQELIENMLEYLTG